MLPLGRFNLGYSMILFLADTFQLPTPQPEDLLQRLSATKAVFSYRCDTGCNSIHIIPINVKAHLKTTNAEEF